MTATTVWMSVYRQGISHHWMTSAAGDEPGQVHLYTMCGRYIGDGFGVRNGILLRDDEAADKDSPACRQCWPEGAA